MALGLARDRVPRKAAGILVRDRPVSNSAAKVQEAREWSETARRMACLARRSMLGPFTFRSARYSQELAVKSPPIDARARH